MPDLGDLKAALDLLPDNVKETVVKIAANNPEVALNTAENAIRSSLGDNAAKEFKASVEIARSTLGDSAFKAAVKACLSPADAAEQAVKGVADVLFPNVKASPGAPSTSDVPSHAPQARGSKPGVKAPPASPPMGPEDMVHMMTDDADTGTGGGTTPPTPPVTGGAGGATAPPTPPVTGGDPTEIVNGGDALKILKDNDLVFQDPTDPTKYLPTPKFTNWQNDPLAGGLPLKGASLNAVAVTPSQLGQIGPNDISIVVEHTPGGWPPVTPPSQPVSTTPTTTQPPTSGPTGPGEVVDMMTGAETAVGDAANPRAPPPPTMPPTMPPPPPPPPQGLSNPLSGAGQAVGDASSDVAQAVTDALSGVREAVTDALSGVREAVTGALSGVTRLPGGLSLPQLMGVVAVASLVTGGVWVAANNMGGTPQVSSTQPNIVFSTPQYLIHATGHGTYSGPVKDDWWFLFPNGPKDNRIDLPDGMGGTFTYSTDYSSGPYKDANGVRAAAPAQLKGMTLSGWNRNNEDFTV